MTYPLNHGHLAKVTGKSNLISYLFVTVTEGMGNFIDGTGAACDHIMF